MSKDVIIAGAIAVGCIALIAVAFIAPKSKPSEGETAKTETTTTTITDNNSFGTLPSTTTATGLDPNAPLPPGPGTSFQNNPGGANGQSPFTTPQFPTTTTGPAISPLPLPPVETAPTTVAEAKTHIVAKDELLGDIALKYYGSSKAWKKIVEANPGLDPKNLKVGQKITIPAATTDKPADAAATATVAGERTYTVKAGDTLYVIAKKELGSASRWKELEKLNGLSSSDLRVGKVIKLPATAGTSTATPGSDIAAPGTAGKVHIVAKGETLGDISAKYLKSSKNWKKLVEVNPGISPENLKVGQKITIPDGGSNDAPTSGTTPTPTESKEYVIKAGETLGTIALHALGSKNLWKEIQEANPGLDSHHLRAGQKIKIPGKKVDPTPTAPVPVAPTPAKPGAHVAPLGAPSTSNLGGPAPTPAGASGLATPFPTDPNFNSPYAGNGFGQPVQPFGQTGAPSAPGTANGLPAPAPGLPNSDPFPAAPMVGAQPAPLR